VDVVGGGILGLCTGVVCSGSLLMLWFSLPFAERSFPVDDLEMFFPCHRYTARAVEFVARRIGGGRPFRGEAYVRDLRFGVPSIPTLGEGYYISSIPTGLRVFMGSGYSAASFVQKIKAVLGKSEDELRPSEREEFGYHGRTPVFVEEAETRGLVAVVMDNLPKGLGSSLSDPREVFVPDGEVGVSMPSVSPGHNLFIKVYRVEKKTNIATLIALFQPKPKPLRGMVERFLPSRECFEFDDVKMIRDLEKHGATHAEALELVQQLHYGGKAYFMGLENKSFVAEIIGPNRWRIFQPAEPENLDLAIKEMESSPFRRR